jgi:hypothetical protein
VKRGRITRRTPLVLLLILAGVTVLLAGLSPAPPNGARALALPGTLPSITIPLLNPEVVSTSPADDETDLPFNPIVSATFSTTMNPFTLSSSSFYLQKLDGTPVPATLKFSNSGVGWYLYPQVILDSGATYVATLTDEAMGINDTVLLYTPVTWSFTTVWFTDVSPITRYAVAISELASVETISGFGDHTFRPDDPVYRQQFAKMIVRDLGLPVTPNDVCPFGDVAGDLDPNDPLYADHYVAVCAAHGITEGMTPSLFAPYESISRFQLISMVVRALNTLQPGLLATPPTTYVSTWDPALSSDHGQNARLAEFNHLLDGLPLAGLDPWGPMSRGEVAQVLRNRHELE